MNRLLPRRAKHCLMMALFALFSVTTYAQSTDRHGIVKDESGIPLPGATVIVRGTQIGASTDLNGRFTVKATEGAMLDISFMGYVNVEMPIKGTNTINITLREDAKTLSDVVVVGYGTMKKSDLTGSVTSVKMQSVKDIPANSVEGLLQGRSAGLQVISSSQDPGAGSTVRIRGGSSLRGSNSPLIVVDGFPLGDAGDLKQINPQDIVNIEVLKDASASAIYGSRGANGVLMVTTRKAKEGTTRIYFKQQTTISEFASKIVEWKDPALMAQLNNENRINGGLPALYIGAENANGIYYPSIDEIQSGAWPHFTNWSDLVFRETPISNNTTVSVSSANSTTSFNAGFNYFNEQGVYVKDDYQKGVLNLGVSHKIFKNLTISSTNFFSKNGRNNNGGLAYYRNPLWPVYNEDGSYFLAGQNDFSHPIALTNHKKNTSTGTDLITSWLIDWEPIEGLSLKSQVNYKYGASISDQYNPKVYTESGTFNDGYASISNWMGQNFSNENYATYDRTFNSIHKLNVMAGHSFESSMSRSSNLSAMGFINEALGNENMGSGDPEKNRVSNGYTKSVLLSFMGRINYSLMDKYLVTVTMRADGSSKFGDNNKWAYFPSGAVSWKLQNEDFIKQMGVFDELKLRASYGVSGNQGISPYQTLSRYGVEQHFDGGKWMTSIGPGYGIGNEGDDGRYVIWGGIPNKNLKWESTSQANVGLDIALFNSRLRITAEYYYKHTYDLLRQRILPLSSGYSRMTINDGEIENKGFEFTIDGNMYTSRDWDISGTLIFSRNRNKVLSLGDELSSGLSTDPNTGMKYEWIGNSLTMFRQTPNILAVGQPMNVFYGVKTNGIVQSQSEGLKSGLTGDYARPGEFNYVDYSGNGKFDVNEDRTIIGDPNPDFTASFNLALRYKNLDVSLFFNGVFGNDIVYQNKWNGGADVMPLRWTVDNPNNSYPALRDGRSYYFSDWFVADGSFVRLQNVNIGYNLNINTKSLKSIRLYVNATNLYTFTGFKGYDPEVGLDGMYWGGYPRLRKWTFGADFTF